MKKKPTFREKLDRANVKTAMKAKIMLGAENTLSVSCSPNIILAFIAVLTIARSNFSLNVGFFISFKS